MRYMAALSRTHFGPAAFARYQILLFQISRLPPVNAKHRSLPEIIRSVFEPLPSRVGIPSSSIEKEFLFCEQSIVGAGRFRSRCHDTSRHLENRLPDFADPRRISSVPSSIVFATFLKQRTLETQLKAIKTFVIPIGITAMMDKTHIEPVWGCNLPLCTQQPRWITIICKKACRFLVMWQLQTLATALTK